MFTIQDYVVITAGSKGINIHKSIFRLICNKLKTVLSHKKYFFTSIPHIMNNQLKNRHIFEYNAKLNIFSSEFITLVPAVTSYVNSKLLKV